VYLPARAVSRQRPPPAVPSTRYNLLHHPSVHGCAARSAADHRLPSLSSSSVSRTSATIRQRAAAPQLNGHPNPHRPAATTTCGNASPPTSLGSLNPANHTPLAPTHSDHAHLGRAQLQLRTRPRLLWPSSDADNKSTTPNPRRAIFTSPLASLAALTGAHTPPPPKFGEGHDQPRNARPGPMPFGEHRHPRRATAPLHCGRRASNGDRGDGVPSRD